MNIVKFDGETYIDYGRPNLPVVEYVEPLPLLRPLLPLIIVLSLFFPVSWGLLAFLWFIGLL